VRADGRYSKQWNSAFLTREVEQWFVAGTPRQTSVEAAEQDGQHASGLELLRALCRGEPVADALHERLYAKHPERGGGPIEWNRLSCFQGTTNQLIAERMLPAGHKAVYVEAILRLQQPPAAWLSLSSAHRFHLCYSEHNPGARMLIEELVASINASQHTSRARLRSHAAPTAVVAASVRDGGRHLWVAPPGGDGARGMSMVDTPHAPMQRYVCGGRCVRVVQNLHCREGVERVGECKHMLVYLTAHTWTSGAQSEAFADDVREAMRRGVHLLLAHEMAGDDQLARHGVDFGLFFSNPEGATPTDLIEQGIYGEIATPLKGGGFRSAGLALLAGAIQGSAAPKPTMSNEASMMARTRRTRRRWTSWREPTRSIHDVTLRALRDGRSGNERGGHPLYSAGPPAKPAATMGTPPNESGTV